MPSFYTKYTKIIQNAIDAGNLKLALKFWKEMNDKAESSNNKHGLKVTKELKAILDEEIIYENALRLFIKAKSEFENKKFGNAHGLFEKAKVYMIKSKKMENAFRLEKLREIDDALYEINQVRDVLNIIDNFLIESDEDKVNIIAIVLGKVAKQTIELVTISLDILISMIDSEDERSKFRSIKGIGEISTQRPGWAYTGILKLVQVSREDQNDDARILALMELSKVGQKNATMLVEHLNPIINALRDSNQLVRRWAVFAIKIMAKALPFEVRDAIPALREALHDDYYLVQKYADKALKLIKEATGE